ncbi:MAG: hypothetical protein ACI4QN_00590 [Candidatus Coproplasma sp.]
MTDEKFKEDKLKEFIDEIYADFERRQQERRLLERGWQLNVNFINGNQYCDVNTLGEIEDSQSSYYWQERRVFNYIAPMVDTRCSRLSALHPRLAVRAASDSEEDRLAANIASSILSAAYEDCDLNSAIATATTWSESCGTAFYKVIWDSDAGNEIGLAADGASVREGRVKVLAVSPFEIYPDSLSEEDLYAQPSIIHARAVPAEDIFAAYGVHVDGRDIDEFANTSILRATEIGTGSKYSQHSIKHGYEVVIEKYVRPTAEQKEGRLTVVAGHKLLYDGPLPYTNGENGMRTYPFVRQCCLPVTGSFFGRCVVDRLIPVQRAYNAVKNRKHEFLNRISMGMLAVEEGSVDTDELIEDGLVPGKVLVYRQGGNPPEMMTMGTVPSEFTQEEERLVEEFNRISGTTDLTQKVSSFTSVTSATGLQLIIEQDEARMNVCYEQVKSALRRAGKFLLRLYKQFATEVRLLKFTGKNGDTAVRGFKGSDITGDDVVIEADSDANTTPARRRAALYEMLDRGLFTDSNGKLSPSFKAKLLETLGYGGYVAEKDLESLNVNRCVQENEEMKGGKQVEVKLYDDDAVHIREHTAYLLTERLSKDEEERICAHLIKHKKKLSEVKNEG